MPTVLCFNDITLSPVIRDNTPWIRSAELARALAYKSEDAVSKIFSRNQDEFSNDMSLTVNLGVSGNPAVTTRIFSLRGCHLIAMFARTPVAKQFRRWVLDVLDKLAAEERALASGEVKSVSDARCRGPVEKEINALIDELHTFSAPFHEFRKFMERANRVTSPLYGTTYRALGWHERCGVSPDKLDDCLDAARYESLRASQQAYDDAFHYLSTFRALARLQGR